ncbi:M35 family metallo-endopeptidase [Rhodanobacter sp. DHB23]|uniref:M35 family metallo-endopeptidase n=1 Tax=Rhodanobacter sp. DHB23 TaxID=2775923 RepID=UPI00177DBD46|nr:M35 family metallo-endopeptidase [Rhodanobacter sp. DHB23]MBD8871363.1 hypothetical protein [Rhodanobacter sp. DHB23]
MKIRFEPFGNSWPPRKSPVTQKFTEQEKAKLEEGVKVAIECSTLAVESMNDDFKRAQKLLKVFFARPADLDRLKAGLRKMHDFLTDDGRTITFVDARGQSEKLLRLCERAVAGVPGRHGAVETVLEGTRVVPMGAGDYAYVKTLADKDSSAATEAHTGSGMRIYIGERGFHPSKVTKDTAETVYHEICHKVLGTVDHAYKVPDCAALANTDRAIQCADSWALFVTAFQFTWPDLDWDPRDLIVTRPRSNAVSATPPATVGRPRSNAISGPPPVWTPGKK